MKIIKEGIDLSIQKEAEKTCRYCNCVFTYIQSDIKSDKDGDYVICPNETCKYCLSI